jgi:DNA replication protein DnaC
MTLPVGKGPGERLLAGLRERLKDVEYCPKCQYPLRLTVDKKCQVCSTREKKHARDMAELEASYVKALGGQRPWVEFTEQGFVETRFNREALAACRSFDPKTDNLFIHSKTPGTGKSRLATIAKRRWLLGAGVAVVTVKLQEIYTERKVFIKEAEKDRELMSRYIKAPILGIEDVGTDGKESEFTVQTNYMLIEGRISDMRNGLVITSNCSLDELEARWRPFDAPGRVASRLRQLTKGKVFNLAGERDWRSV